MAAYFRKQSLELGKPDGNGSSRVFAGTKVDSGRTTNVIQKPAFPKIIMKAFDRFFEPGAQRNRKKSGLPSND